MHLKRVPESVRKREPKAESRNTGTVELGYMDVDVVDQFHLSQYLKKQYKLVGQ